MPHPNKKRICVKKKKYTKRPTRLCYEWVRVNVPVRIQYNGLNHMTTDFYMEPVFVDDEYELIPSPQLDNLGAQE